MYEFAKRTNVGLYIGVERHLDASLSGDPHTDVSNAIGTPPKNEMKHILVQNDALDFIARMENNAIIDDKPVNITINGLDNWILDYPEYNQALAKEIVRVITQGGIVFELKSSVVTYLSSFRELKSLEGSSLLQGGYDTGEHAKGNAEYYHKNEDPEFQRNRYYMVDSGGHSITLGYFIFEKQ